MTLLPTGHPVRPRRSGSRMRDERGFTIAEMLVATAIMLAVTAATFNLMNPAQGMFAAQPEVSDMQQRLRIGVETLYKDLLMAGAGTYSGAGVGTLGNYFASVIPGRIGDVTPDPPGTFRTDRITLLYVPPTASQTTIRDAMPAQAVPNQGQRPTRVPERTGPVRVQGRA